ncbi:MAG TPA: endolytic transglycosylase MltG [Acidimicrobiia bacterium]|nr:endolytic transglycosylase MltG [Acidimicrobiia bacterium]
MSDDDIVEADIVDEPDEPGVGDERFGSDPPARGWRGRRRASRLERSSRRRIALAIVLLVGLPLVLVGGVVGWVWWQLDPPGGAGGEVEIEVAEGWSTSEIADELSRHGVIGSTLVFTTYAGITDAGPFQAGSYVLQEDLGIRDAIDVLEAGPTIVFQDLAIPPGRWLPEVAQLVAEQLPGRSAEDFLAVAQSGTIRSRFQPEGVTSLEGFLWPDTYRFTDADDETTILRTMVEQFDEVAERAGLATTGTEGRTPYEILTIASMIQQEAKLDEDRALIASVIYNRLRDGMPLQIDATVIYGVGQATGARPTTGLTATQLETDTPWNTYTRATLPATPISSITEASLLAALAPATSPFRYYVLADAEGRHAFAETYEEHLENVAAARAQGLLG